MMGKTNTGWPALLYTAEIGPALKFASQIMISLTAEPPEVEDVNMSNATSATTVPLLVCDHVHTACEERINTHTKRTGAGRTGMDLMAESCLLTPVLAWTLVKLLTPVPPEK
jgi:hypothetical protein